MITVGRFTLLSPDEPASNGSIPIRLLPTRGRFYGQGWQPDTRAILEVLLTLDIEGKTVFDVGTGTGILAIAAAKLGASEVYAVDINEEVVRVARDQAALNNVDITFDYPDHADIILANLGDAAFVRDIAAHAAWMAENPQWGGTYTFGELPATKWLGERLQYIGATVVTALPEHSEVLGDALLEGFAVRTIEVQVGLGHAVVAILKRDK